MSQILETQPRKPGLRLFDVYVFLLFIFPIFTILGNEGIINKVLFAVLFMCQLCITLITPMKVGTLFQLLLTIVIYIYSLTVTQFPVENINLFFYFPYAILYMFFVLDNRGSFIEWFKRNEKYVRFVIRLWCLIVFISMFLPSAYYEKEGGTRFFGSFCGTIFRLGPAAMFIQVLILASMKIYGRRKDFFYNIVPMYSFFMGSSRTYLVIGLCLFVIAWNWFVNNKKTFAWTLIPIVALAVVFVFRTSIGEKIAYTLDDSNYGDFWFRITSSRSLLWEIDMRAWSQEPLLNKLLGCGIDFTMDVSHNWGHNDFVELICSFGLLGVLQYVGIIIKLMKANIINKRTPALVAILVVVVWLFNAFFNMHYVYFCAMLAYPLLLLVISEGYLRKVGDGGVSA